jgi:translocation and assembly module TamB
MLALLVLIMLLWIVVAGGIGLGLVVPWALARAAPEGWTVRVGSVEGAWHRLVHIHDLAMEGPQGTLTAEALRLEFRLLPLLERTIDVRSVQVSSPTLEGELPGSATEAPRAESAGPSAIDRLLSGSPLGEWTMQIVDLRIDDGEAVLEGSTGAYRIERADLAGAARLSPDGTAFVLDSLVVEGVPPRSDPDSTGWESSHEQSGSVHLRVHASLEDGALHVSSLGLRSARSDVTGAGNLLVAAPATSEAGYVENVDFRLEADPLDLRDLPFELPPALADDPRLTLQLTASGPPERVSVALEASGPGSLSARAEGLLRAAKEGSPDAPTDSSALRLDARVSLDLAEWATSPYAGQLSADLEIALDALDAASALHVDGTLVHSPPAEAPAGLVGSALRVDMDVTRTALPHSESDTARKSIQATAFLYRPPRPLSSTQAFVPAELEWIETGALSAQVEGSRSSWQVDLLLDSGTVEGTGEISWAANSRELVIDALSVRRLDLSLVLARLPATAIDAWLEGRVTGSSITDLAGRVAMSLDSSRVAETTIDTASVSADLVAGSITGSAMLESDPGHIEADYRVLLGDSLVEATVTRFEGVAMGSATEEDAPPAWRALGSGVVTWALGETRRGTLSASLDTASIGAMSLLGASVEGEILGDSVRATASAELAQVLSAPAALRATAAVRGTSPSEATGLVEVHAARFHLEEADSSARSSVVDSAIVSISAAEPGSLVLDGRILPGEGGLIDLSGSATVADSALSFVFDARGTLGTPTELLSGGSIQRIALESSGVRSPAGWQSASAALLVTDGLWRGVEADTLRSNLHYDSSGLGLDTLALDSNVLTLAGSGLLPASVADTSSIRFTAHFDLEPMRGHTETELPTIGGNELTATISGTTDSVSVSMTSSMTALVHRQIRVSGFEAVAEALLRPPFVGVGSLASGNARVQLDRISLPDAEIGNLRVTTEGTADSLRLEATAVVDQARGGELQARIDFTPDQRMMELDRLELQLDQDEWELIQPAVLSFRDGLALRGFELRAGEQAISIDGGMTADGALDLELAMDSTDVSTVADLAGFPRLAGWLGGRASLRGTRDAPVGTVDLLAGFHETDEPPTTARITLDSDGSLVETDVSLVGPEGGSLTVSGLVPLAEGRAVDLSVDAEAFSVAPAVVFVDGELLAEIEGRIDAELAVTGPREEIGFDGPLTLLGGLADIPPLGVTWEDIHVVSHGEGRQLVIDSARVESGSGSMGIGGSVTVEDMIELDLRAGFDQFQAIQTSVYRASISGDLRASGTPLAPVVEGEVTTESLDVYIDERPSDGGLEDVELTPADLEILRERFGYVVVEDDVRPRTSELLTADVTVEFGRDSWIRSRSTPEMAVGFAGEVDVQVRPGEEPQLQGTLTTIPDRGYIAQFGKRFSPREGTVTLDGPPADAVLDLSASYTVPSHANPDGAEATIVLGVTGTQEELSLTLSSEPPMENADIVSYIATGRPAASTFALGNAEAETIETDPPGGGLAETGAGIAVGQILSSIETAAQTGVGLDVVEIQNDGIRGATLVAGKYLSPRLYVGFAQPLRSASEIEVEFLALQNLLLNLEGSASSLSVFLRGRVVY